MLPGSHGPAPFLSELPPQAQLPRVESAGEERLSVPDLACRGGGVQLFISAVSLRCWPLCWFQPPEWGRDSSWEKRIEGQITDEYKINPT